jgi:alpha-glucosidase
MTRIHNHRISLRSITAICLVHAAAAASLAAGPWTLDSPSSRLHVKVEQRDGIWYSVSLGDTPLIIPSQIDLKVDGVGWFAQQPGEPKVTQESKTETVKFTVPRKYRERDTKYNELTLEFPGGARLVFRAYDEGVAYRWETNSSKEITVDDEQVQFIFAGNPHAWFPEEESIFSHQERVYKYLPVADVGSDRFCSTGLLIDLPAGHKLFISESDLRSYPGMFLRGVGNHQAGLVGKFAGYPLETEARDDRNVPVTKAAPYLAKTDGKRTFPWRVMIVSDQDKDLLQSELIYELAAPLSLSDTSWIKPGKVAWDWWNGIDVTGVDFRAGVNTATYQYFIDFAADFGIQYILLDEGWTASSTDILHDNPNVDLAELVRYAKQKGVGVLVWVLWKPLDEHMAAALDRFQQLGVAGVKVDFMQRDDQWMIDFYLRVAREAAKRHLMVDFHGACKPTGWARAYPNVMTSEGVNGMEQYKWTADHTNPEHELILPFTRMMAGPMDFTPGAMTNANRANFRPIMEHPMSMGTRCHQLAMYVVYESPLQMLCDSPTRYRHEPECMKFLSAVPTVWDDTIALDAKVSDYVAIARRSGDDWFIGAMTDWDRRKLEISLSFLPAGQYHLEVWRDGPNADRDGQDFARSTQIVTSADKLALDLAPGGGWVGWLRPFEEKTVQP